MKLKQSAIALAMVSNFIFTPTVKAGIPVIDPAAIAQMVLEYDQSILDFAEFQAIAKDTLGTYNQVVDTYDQIMVEYDLLLESIKDLQDSLSPSEWAAFVNEVVKTYGNYDIGITAQLDPMSSTYATDVQHILQDLGLAPSRSEDVVSDNDNLATSGLDMSRVEANSDVSNKLYTKYANQFEVVSTNVQSIQQLELDRAEAAGAVAGLGENSELATLQMIASLLVMQQEQNILNASISNQQLHSYEPPSAERAATHSQLADMELRRLQKIVAKPPLTFSH